MRAAEPPGAGCAPRWLFRRARHRPHARRDVLVACPPRHTGLGHAGRSGPGRRLARFPPAGAHARHRDPGRVQPGHLPARLACWPDHTGKRRERMGAARDRSRRIRAVLLLQGPARGVRGRRHADAHRGQGLGAVRVRHRDRRAQDRGRPAARALLHRPARGPAGPARPGRTCRAGALPARRAGQGRGTGPARGRNARRRDAPRQPDGAAGRRARHHRRGRGDQAGRGRPAGRGLPGAG